MINFINQIINGLSTGSMYALVAIGYTMVYLEYCREHQNMNVIIQKILATFLWYCENDQLCPW